MLSIGQRLKYLRKKADKTQQEVAKSLNIQQTTYSYYENDKRTPDVETIAKFCKIYDTSADFILGLSNNPRPYKVQNDLYEIIASSQLLVFEDIEISEKEKNIVLKTLSHALRIIEEMNKED